MATVSAIVEGRWACDVQWRVMGETRHQVRLGDEEYAVDDQVRFICGNAAIGRMRGVSSVRD
jgi:hypothetical protein